MLSGRVKIAFAAFLLLSGGVAGNLLLLQQAGRGAAITQSSERDGARRLAGSQSIGFGGPSSIGLPNDDGRRTELQPGSSRDHGAGNVGTAGETPDDALATTRAIQRELQSRGYDTGTPDGVAGLVTRAAIMAFEFDHGLPLTGRPNEKLLKYILLGSDGAPVNPSGAVSVQSAEAEDVIRSVQRSLAKLGYRPGRINGKLGPSTASAIRKFELDQAMPESGCVSGPLVSRLTRLSDRGRLASGRR